MKCSEGVNEMSGLGGERLNCKISLIGSILSVKNEMSCKNGGLKCIMFGLLMCTYCTFIFLFYTACPKKVTRVLN